jgi:transposase InsO family protein
MIGSPETGSRLVCGGNYVLQNPANGRKSREIARLEHINGDEPYSTLWVRVHNVENAYIESFNGRFRDECLNEHWFVTMAQARQVIEKWRIEYNTERPHSSLGDQTPEQFAKSASVAAEGIP